MQKRTVKILAVASKGGHWIQLTRLRPAFVGAQVVYVSTDQDLEATVPGENFKCVVDANLDEKFKLIVAAIQSLVHFLWIRPDVVITTGAAPGFIFVVLGKIFKKKTIWIDSIANSEELSKAGRYAKNYATHWLTQWEDLATDVGPKYLGSVI